MRYGKRVLTKSAGLPVVPICRMPSPCAVGQINTILSRIPSRQEGRTRGRHETWDGMRWTRRSRQTNDAHRLRQNSTGWYQAVERFWRRLVADGEVVWSWRAHAGAKFRGHDDLRGDGGNKLVHRGEPEVSRKPPRREGRSVSACTCGHAPFAQSLWREGPGCSGHPAFPAPSSFRGQSPAKARAHRAPRERGRATLRYLKNWIDRERPAAGRRRIALVSRQRLAERAHSACAIAPRGLRLIPLRPRTATRSFLCARRSAP